MNNNLMTIVAQAFYGNRTLTETTPEDFDRFMLGYLDDKEPVLEPIDRTFIAVPGSDRLVFVYNKYQEECRLDEMQKATPEQRRYYKPLLEIPEQGIRLYSRVLVCRRNPDGEVESLQPGDIRQFIDYLAK